MRCGILLLSTALAAPASRLQAQLPRIEISIDAAAHSGPLTGRLVLVVARRAEPEPRYAISPSGPALFAVDLDALPAGRPVVIDSAALGFPWPLAQLPPGDYFLQAVVNVYELARRADGHRIWVHLNDGSQEPFQVAAGNLYSEVVPFRLGPGVTARVAVTHRIPPAEPAGDTDWVKHLRVQSAKLTAFWGRPVYLNATVLLPRGYADHAATRYPVVFTLGHSVPFSFSTDSARARGLGTLNPVTGLETGFDFYRAWSADGFPRIVAVSLEQQTPYFPDSYSVNSANNGPYGDAVVEELIPELERRFRLIGKPYARLLEGASTGGWQSLALQLQHPDFFGGAWVLQPDPVDFRRDQLVNIYEDTSAFALPTGPFTATERPFRRTTQGQVVWTLRQLSLFEEVLGTRGRSGYQLEGWEAVYGPVGADGYPRPLWNKLSGVIDKEVAAYWKEHGFDLRDYAQRNWPALGPRLAGKLHFFAGDMDDFYLNLAVYQFEDFLKSTSNPHSDAEFTYGRPTKGHSWHAFPWADLVRRMAAHIKRNAPAGEPADWLAP
ncbi:MAG TPA: alpha/beta hydrolase-fold protein [Gemmatimonadales bacterium]|nr:alpha/beta hydrolase-fold protein [Gemmatimonadales bacterium]